MESLSDAESLRYCLGRPLAMAMLQGGYRMATVKDHQPVLSPLEIRRRLEISQEAMSSLLRVSVKTISRWEKDHGQPRAPEQLTRLARL